MSTTKDFLAGDYQLQDVVIFGQTLPRLSCRNLMLELNIYESMNTPYMSGNIVLRDTMNHRSNMSMTGQEEIEFELRTNDECESIDFKTFRGRIYKISNIIPTSNTEQVYTLHFVSMDAMRNTQTRVKQTYRGSTDEIISDVLTNVLKTDKNFHAEQSSKFTTLVGNNRYPFEFIRMAAKRSISRDYNFMTYSFFENHRGYNFVSKQSLINENRVETREPVESFFTAYQKSQVDTPIEMRTLKSFQVTSMQDTLRDNSNGLLNNTHYTYDRTNKTFTKDISSYATYLNNVGINKSPLYTSTPEIDSKSLTDFPDSTITVSSKDPFVHTSSSSDTQNYSNSSDRTADALRGSSSFGIRLKVEMHGNSNLAAGDLIHITYPNHEPIVSQTDDKTFDVFLTGHYLIESINHRVDNNQYVTTCELIRNDVDTTYESNDTSIKENNKTRFNTPRQVIDRL